MGKRKAPGMRIRGSDGGDVDRIRGLKSNHLLYCLMNTISYPGQTTIVQFLRRILSG